MLRGTEKSIFSPEYSAMLRRLRRARQCAGITQRQVAENLGVTQSFVSKCERGERRIDVIELIHLCRAVGVSPVDFVRDLTEAGP